MKLWVLWIIWAHHGALQRGYVQTFGSQATCERAAAIENRIASDRYDWICLPPSAR